MAGSNSLSRAIKDGIVSKPGGGSLVFTPTTGGGASLNTTSASTLRTSGQSVVPISPIIIQTDERDDEPSGFGAFRIHEWTPEFLLEFRRQLMGGDCKKMVRISDIAFVLR